MKYKCLVILFLLLIPLTGCWDSIDIEDRGFVIGTAVDLEEMKTDRPIYSITDQLVLPTSFGPNAQSSEDAFINSKLTGPSIYETNEEFATLSSKTPYYEHVKIIVISEKLAKMDHLMPQLLDQYIRDIDLRRGIHVVIAENKASSLLEKSNPESKLPAIHINQMLKQNSKFVGFLEPLTLGDIEEHHLRKRSYVLPLMSIDEDKIKRQSGAVFHGIKEKMIGSFNTKEMQGLELYKGDATGNVIEFTYKGETFAFEINQIKNKYTIDNSKTPNLNVDTNIILYGTIKEAPTNENFVNAADLQSIQKGISKEATKIVEETIEKAQKEYRADVFNLWQKLQTKDYNTWKEVKDNWEEGKEYFANNVTFNIDVKTEIYSVGTSEQTTR